MRKNDIDPYKKIDPQMLHRIPLESPIEFKNLG